MTQVISFQDDLIDTFYTPIVDPRRKSSYNHRVWKTLARKQLLGWIAAVIVMAAATIILRNLGEHVNLITVALALLLIVLFVATAWGPKPAILASLLGGASFNFFFIPPLHTFTIADPQNWTAVFAFLITAITVGQLSSRAKLRADEATDARKEIERLYYELQDTFQRSSQAKALKQSERLKTALLDAVTHDLRTPLTAIKASVTTLLDDQRLRDNGQSAAQLSKEGQQEMLEVIDEEADRLNRFIEDLMSLARLEAGEMQLHREWGSLEEIVSAALKRASPSTKNHRVELRLKAELPSVRVDERAMAEVIFVLLENAAKYSPPGVILVAAEPGPQGMVCLSIEDQGSGIPAELRKRVFDKFFRAVRDGDLPSQRPGTGMGLAIAKGIVEAHGGRIWIEDPKNLQGTRVVILLPTGDVEGDDDDARRGPRLPTQPTDQ